MIITVTVEYSGPPVCQDCYDGGQQECGHVGLNPAVYQAMLGREVHIRGLDPAAVHVLRRVEMAGDGYSVALTVESSPGHVVELGLPPISVRHTPRAIVRPVLEDGETLADVRLDAPLHPGQVVYVNGTPYGVQEVAWPNRGETGTVPPDVDDVQVAQLAAQAVADVQPAGGE